MPELSDLNDLYQEWLEIPADRLPPNHYALLGIADYEADESRIDAAAKSRNAYLHQIAAGPQRKIVQQMLGQVAMARRTLMHSESREQYNQALRAGGAVLMQPGHVSELNALDGAQVDRSTGGVATGAASLDPHGRPDGTPFLRRSKASDWRYHAISAAVLLSVVGMVYYFNRNPGGRRAAQARATDAKQGAGATDDADWGGDNTGATVSGPVRKANPRIAPVRTGNQSTSRRPSPIAKRRDTGSGIGSGLGDKFADVLSEIASQPSNANSAGASKSDSGNQFRSLGGLLIGEAEMVVQPGSWPESLAAVREFPSQLSKRFQCAGGFKWFDVDSDKLVVKSTNRGNVFQLSDQHFSMSTGAAVSLETSLVAKMRPEMNVGVEIDQVRVGIRPSPKGVQVYVRGSGANGSIQVLTEVSTTSKPTTLTIERDTDDSDLIRWFAKSADQSFTGTIGVPSLEQNPSTSIYVSSPKRKSDQPFWISNLMMRPGE